ncbi:hypothetical protein MA20_45370 [Bradyrhizobium japonicum]|uniref:Uncharacterized protein n=1 Tax=Bradyrhizobium japonicum TaxID=375 RepID=A0A0A3XJ17_BRAJP|nr:hypothetical protein MA20_45370 [Bradyrhizobium japonicum]
MPIAEDEHKQLDAGQASEEPALASVVAGLLKITEELRYSLMENGGVIAATLVDPRPRRAGLADTRWTGEDQIDVYALIKLP